MDDAKATWMRRIDASEASWDPSGNLLSLKLNPSVSPDTEETTTQPSISPQEQARRERDKRIAIMSRSSGGPVPRLSEGD